MNLGTRNFYDLAHGGSYLNRKDFVHILAEEYRISPRNAIVGTKKDATGVPAFLVRSFLSGRKITSMPFNFYPPLEGSADQRDAVGYLIDLAKSEGHGCYVEYKTLAPLSASEVDELRLVHSEFSILSDLPLQSTIEAQRFRYKKRHRTKINKALRNSAGFEIAEATTEAELAEWYWVLLRLYRDKHRMICQPYSLFRRLFALKDVATLLLARRNGEIAGGLFLMHDAKRWDYCWGAVEGRHEADGAGLLLLDTAIRLSIEAGASIFSFGSTAKSDVDLLFFKQRWGCEERTVHAYYWNHQPKPIDLNESFGIVRKVIPLLPLRLLKLVANRAVRHLT